MDYRHRALELVSELVQVSGLLRDVTFENSSDLVRWNALLNSARSLLRHDAERRLIGKLVEVSYANDKPVARGRLLGFGDDGQFELLDESDGAVHYCWPLLSLKEIPQDTHEFTPALGRSVLVCQVCQMWPDHHGHTGNRKFCICDECLALKGENDYR